MSTVDFDCIIVGGGVAGSSVALSLLRSKEDASFLLVDDADSSQFKVGESLPAGAKPKLQSLSPAVASTLSVDVSKGVHLPCSGNASVWGSPDVQETFSITNVHGEGLHLDRAAFDESLRDAVREAEQQSSTSRRLLKRRFVGARREEGQWIVQLAAIDTESGPYEEYRSLWLIDASGRKASVATKLGAKTTRLDGLLAFYALFSSSEVDYDRRIFIEATENGWWYSSQLHGNTRVVVFHTDDRDPASKVARKQQGYLDLLFNETTHISAILREGDYHMLPEGKYPRCTAASTSCLAPCGSEVDSWCAVGDAAIAFDPLSSQGMMTALRCGTAVGEMLADRLRPGSEAGLTQISDLYNGIWRDYEKHRRYFYSQAMFDGEFWKRRR